MTDNTPFDQALFDTLMEGYPTEDAEIEGLDPHDAWYAAGRKAAAHDAARIAAELATPMPSDEAIDFGLRAVLEAYDYPQDVHVDNLVEDLIHEMRQVFPAAQPLTVPSWVRDIELAKDAEQSWFCHLFGFDPDSLASGHGTTWQEALAAAIAATGEGE